MKIGRLFEGTNGSESRSDTWDTDDYEDRNGIWSTSDLEGRNDKHRWFRNQKLYLRHR